MMTTAEFKLAATGIGILLVLGGMIAWSIYDLLMAREKRKRREDYNEWFNIMYAESLRTRAETLERCQVRIDAIRDRLWDVQSDEYWEDWGERVMSKQEEYLTTLQNNRHTRPKLDYYKMKTGGYND